MLCVFKYNLLYHWAKLKNTDIIFTQEKDITSSSDDRVIYLISFVNGDGSYGGVYKKMCSDFFKPIYQCKTLEEAKEKLISIMSKEGLL